jgi:hypothetical protein
MNLKQSFLKNTEMTNQLNLMQLPADVLSKFARNFKLGLVNKECNDIRKKINIGFNPRARVTRVLIQELKTWLLQQFFYQRTGYILNLVSEEEITDEYIYTFRLNTDELFELWDDLEIPGIEILESLI